MKDNYPVVDPGTLPRGATPCPGTVCFDKHVIDHADVQVIQENLLLMRKDVEAAVALMNSLLGQIPPNEREQYKADRDQLICAQYTAEFVWKKQIADGRVDVGNDANRLWDNYMDALVALEQTNWKWQNLISAAQLNATAAVLLGILVIIKGMETENNLLIGLLKNLKQKLEKAKNEVTEAKIQTGINIALYAINLALPCTGTLSLFIKAVTLTSASLAADKTLGPEKENLVGDLNTAGGNLLDSFPKLTEAQKQFGSLGSAFLTTWYDTQEIKHAIENVESIKRDINVASRKLDWLIPELKKALPQVRTLKEGLDKIIKAYQEALSKGNDANQEYQRIRKNTIKQRTGK